MSKIASTLTRVALLVWLFAVQACGGDDSKTSELHWTVLEEDRPGALVSVWGQSATDVWIVGGDQGDGQGPTVLRHDGEARTSLSTGIEQGDLWWVNGVAGGPVFMAGKDGLILRYQDDAFERMETPSTATVFGVWAASADDAWAVGGDANSGAFAWRLQGGRWQAAEGFPTDVAANASLRKVWGTASDNVWMVGTDGTVLHYDGSAFEVLPPPTQTDLFTVHAAGDQVAIVGGVGKGVIYEWQADALHDVTPDQAVELTGVWLEGGTGYAVGSAGNIYQRQGGSWKPIYDGALVSEDLHSVWVDPNGCVFAAGGRWRAYPLTRGLLLRGCRDDAK
jgi:hypothetical protein